MLLQSMLADRTVAKVSSAAMCSKLCCVVWQGYIDRDTAVSHTAEEHGQGHVACNAAGAQAFPHLLLHASNACLMPCHAHEIMYHQCT